MEIKMTIYTNTARFDTGRALTEDELFKLAPSIFAHAPHESRSERFQAIPTIEVLRGLSKEGFECVGVKQSVCRDKGKKPFTKHLLRIRRMGDQSQYRVGDTVCEILLKNANDGTSRYNLMAGLFRIACMNSLVTQTGTIDEVKVSHIGNVQEKVIEGTYRVLGEAQKALVAPADWSNILLNKDEKNILAETAHEIRFTNQNGEINTPIKPRQMLIPRRVEDQKDDLWTVANVLQENTIRGGLSAIGMRDYRERRVTTRGIRGIDQDVRLNKALWIMTEKFAALKTA